MTQLFLVCALLAVVLPFIMSATVERYQAELGDGTLEGEGILLSCMCENSTDVSEPLNEDMASAILKGEFRLADCRNSDARDICGLLLLCAGCAVRHLSCHPSEEAHKLQCMNEIYLLNDNYFGVRERQFKDVITIERARVKRRAHICTYPSNLKTADVVCQTSGNKVTCTQSCIFGHTLKEGVVKTMVCKKNENVWKPSGFVECDPFVDCSLSLRSPGAVDCYSGTTRSAPLCYVSCNHYEDRPVIPRRAYECTISGTWNRPLPFCVTTGSGLLLVRRPEKFVFDQDYS